MTGVIRDGGSKLEVSATECTSDLIFENQNQNQNQNQKIKSEIRDFIFKNIP